MAIHNSIPTMGFPSKTAAIVALHRSGMANIDIRKMTGATRGAVGRAIHEYRAANRLPVTSRPYRAKDVKRGANW